MNAKLRKRFITLTEKEQERVCLDFIREQRKEKRKNGQDNESK